MVSVPGPASRRPPAMKPAGLPRKRVAPALVSRISCRRGRSPTLSQSASGPQAQACLRVRLGSPELAQAFKFSVSAGRFLGPASFGRGCQIPPLPNNYGNVESFVGRPCHALVGLSWPYLGSPGPVSFPPVARRGRNGVST